MFAIKVFHVVTAIFFTFCALAAFAGAQLVDVVLPFNPYPLTRTATSEYSISDYTHILDGTTSVYAIKVPRDEEYFTIPPVRSTASALTTVSTVSAFSGPGVFGITTTPTLRETASVACSAVFHNPGLALHPCFSKATDLSTSRVLGSSGMVTPSVNISTVTTTQVKSVTTTRTVTLTLSEVSGSSSSPVTTVTAMCLWADQAILTPCTSVVAASSKPTSAAAANPLAAAVGVSFLWALALGGLLG